MPKAIMIFLFKEAELPIFGDRLKRFLWKKFRIVSLKAAYGVFALIRGGVMKDDVVSTVFKIL